MWTSQVYGHHDKMARTKTHRTSQTRSIQRRNIHKAKLKKGWAVLIEGVRKDQYRQLLNLKLEKKALFLLTTIKVVFSLANVFSTSPISVFFTKCSDKDVYNVEKSKVLISKTMLRLDFIARITSRELSIDQNKLTPEFASTLWQFFLHEF